MHLYTGLYVQRTVDLYLPDVIPIVLRRTYRQNDGLARPFGVSTTHPYEIYLEGAAGSDLYAYIELVLPDGAHVHYDHVPGADPWLYEHTGTPSRYYKSRLKWTSATVGWTLTFTDGTVYSFPDAGFQTRTAKGALTGIRDRFGNRLTVDRDATTGNVQKITSPHGRWVAFTYDASGGRPDSIKTATDNGGRVVTYTYDAQNRLIQVDDVGGGKTTYAYSGLTDRMTTVTNAREWDNDCGTPCAVPPVPFLTNEFLSDGKVKKQTLADGNYFQFTYTIDGSGNAQTDLEDRRHNIRRVTFNSEGYELTITLGANLPASQQLTTTYTRGTTPPDNRLRNFVTLVTDPLILASTGGPRQTKLDYYSETGKIQRITRLFGTAAPLTTDFTYEPRFAQLASLTDASGHATTIAFDPYDPRALPHRIMDATNRQVQLSFTGDGQLQSMTTPFLTTDPPQGIPTMSFAYASGDLVGITDSAGNAITRFVDNLGRVRSVTNALGQTTTYSYDNVGRVQDITDPLAGATRLRYDKNGNLKSVEDARQSGLNHKTTSLTYDALDRLATRQDPLGRTPEILTYDQEGNLSTYTDRRGKIADYGYDEFNRRKCAGFGRSGGGMDCTVPASYERAIQYTYDNASRLTRGNDSLTGIITLGYDDADHQTSEVSTQASLTYTFDGDRRKTLTIAGQPQRCYDYDNANRLTGLRWGGCGANPAVSIAHDEQGRRGTVTLANGVSQTYGYEPRSYVSSIQYQSGTIVLGGLIYTYNATGNRLTTSGTLARTGLPNAVSANTISHDDANELKQWATATPTLSYDNAGNLVGDGNNVYVWDARNQLVSITGAATVSFQYDAFQRRIARTPQSGIATNFVNDKLNRAESIVGGVVSSQITGLGLDDNFAQFDGTTLTGFSTDALGSTLMVSNGGGAIGAQYTYEPFGLSSNNGASPSTELQFTGRENDNTGLAYYRARYYAPQWGRFITEDPIVLPRLLHQDGTSMIMQRSGSGAADDPVLSLALALSTPSLSLRGLPLGGLYAYADNNPLNLIDPTGLAAAASGPSSAFPHPRIPEKECTVWCGCVFVVCNCFRSDHGCWTQSYRGVVIPGLPVGFRVFTCAAFDAGILGGT